MRISEKYKISALCLYAIFGIIGCDGGVFGSGGNPMPDDVTTPTTEAGEGQVLLGPVVNSAVAVYGLPDLSYTICETFTQDSDDLAVAGTFNLVESCNTNAINEHGIYLIVVSGGADIDKDDDGVLDDEPTDLQGRLHTVMTGKQILQGGWKVSALTQGVYQSFQALFENNQSPEEVLASIEEHIIDYLNEDIDGDGKIDLRDLQLWNTRTHNESLTPFGKTTVNQVLDVTHLPSPTLETIELDYPIVGHVDTLSEATNVHLNGTMAYVLTNAGIQIIDVKDVTHPVIVATIPASRTSKAVVDGNMLVLGGYSDLKFYDITDINKPKLRTTLPILDRSLYDMAIQDKNLIILTQEYIYNLEMSVIKLNLIDLSNLDTVQINSSVEIDEKNYIAAYELQQFLAIRGNTVFVGLQSGDGEKNSIIKQQTGKMSYDLVTLQIADKQLSLIAQVPLYSVSKEQLEKFLSNDYPELYLNGLAASMVHSIKLVGNNLYVTRRLRDGDTLPDWSFDPADPYALFVYDISSLPNLVEIARVPEIQILLSVTNNVIYGYPNNNLEQPAILRYSADSIEPMDPLPWVNRAYGYYELGLPAISNGYAFIADHDRGLVIIDVHSSSGTE